jgi:hypothetical protein
VSGEFITTKTAWNSLTRNSSVHRRIACNRHNRHTCFLWARACHMLKDANWQKAYLATCKDRGDALPTRYRKLGAKLMAILFRCLCSNQPYDEDHFLKHRHHVYPARLNPA